jgi:hypothetical protein
MKILLRSGPLLSLSTFYLLLSTFAFAQGQLNPPGTPAPTMKSLDQVEARTVIDSRQPGFTLPYTISSPGSYYLAANITATGSTAGIIVSADNVTIDLNGFTVTGGGGGTASGIKVPAAQKNLCVRNGTLTGWSFHGVDAGNAVGSLYENLRLFHNNLTGAFGAGLQVGYGSTVRACVAQSNNFDGFGVADGSTVVDCTAISNNQGDGFRLGAGCTIINCTSRTNGGNGISTREDCSVLHCTCSNNNFGNGILAYLGCTVADCTAGSNDVGITVDTGSSVHGCVARNNLTNGINATNSCFLVGNACNGNNKANSGADSGILVSGGGNTIDSNSSTANGNGVGIAATGSHNIIIRNSAMGNGGGNYNVGSGNAFGPVVDMSAGGQIPNTGNAANPWTNWIH